MQADSDYAPGVRAMFGGDVMLGRNVKECILRFGPDYPLGPIAPLMRDADLTAHDRVELLIDVDRDYATYFHLAVDYRGWAAESCVGDRNWDPQWFVAVDSNPGEWVVEAAISINDLSSRKPATRDAWAIGIQRIVPNVGFQAWSEPAAVQIRPEGFGYLVFE